MPTGTVIRIFGQTRGKAREWARGNNTELEKRAKRGDSDLLPYLRKAAYFFSVDFLVRRMFETLNAENKPEHYGFRRACDALYPAFAAAEGATDESLLEYLYDDMFTTLYVPRAVRWFQFLGVVKPEVVPSEHGDDKPPPPTPPPRPQYTHYCPATATFVTV